MLIRHEHRLNLPWREFSAPLPTDGLEIAAAWFYGTPEQSKNKDSI
jgi:hypothetical protein